uniref:W2 domain-containing protein n=1 Tax=Acrobeloides nanus TaxID=290746 RepID=A0A914CNV4_9BILA
MDNVAKNVFASFLALPPVEKGLSGFKKLCKEWTLIWTNYYKPPQSQTQMLHAIEERAAEISSFQKIVPNIIHFLFNDVDVLNEDVILDWYDNLPEDSPLKELVKPVIEWLREDSDDEDSDEEDSDKEN